MAADIRRTPSIALWLGVSAFAVSIASCSPSEPAPAEAPAEVEGAQATAAAAGLPTATPEDVGFRSDGLQALSAELHSLVDAGKLAGVQTLVARKGKVVHFDTYGKADISTGAALEPDSIFRIASMTKPIAGVAMMQLYEKGLWAMDDPVAKFIPEFADLKVKNADGSLSAQASPMTMAQLMSHTAGFDVSSGYADAGLSDTNLQGMIDKLSGLPLAAQPGTDWRYGPSVNIQGYIVEKLSGQPLDVYFNENIFGPLGMTDTGFWVPAEKASRVVTVHTYNEAGQVIAAPPGRSPTEVPTFLSASGGLLSTTSDYWRFSQALANGGELNGAHILKPETVELMRVDVLAPGVMLDLYGPTQPGIGFGMDFAVVKDPGAAGSPQGVGTYYWGGAFGTWFWIDPTNDVVFVGMIQNVGGSIPGGGTPPMREISPRLTYAALVGSDE